MARASVEPLWLGGTHPGAGPSRNGGDRQASWTRPACQLRADLVPILEPEVDIASPDKADAEALFLAGVLDRLGNLPTATG